MATFKLGAIITDIAGSIGGTTLKRNGSYRVIMNKPSGTTYSRLLQNRAISYLGSIFKAWTFLDTTVKEAWNTAALSYTFPDKFGALRNLTGRQLFIKLNSQNYVNDTTIINPADVNSDVPVFVLEEFIYTEHDGQLVVTTSNASTLYGAYLYMFEVSLKPLHAPTFIAREVVDRYTDSANFSRNVTAVFMAKFPYWTPHYNARVYVTTMNNVGFRSVMQSANLQILP